MTEDPQYRRERRMNERDPDEDAWTDEERHNVLQDQKFRRISGWIAYTMLGLACIVTIVLLTSALNKVENQNERIEALSKQNAALIQDANNNRRSATAQICYQENGQNRTLRNLILGGTFARRDADGKAVSTAPEAIEAFYRSIGFTPEIRQKRAEDQAESLPLVSDCDVAAARSIAGDPDAAFPMAPIERQIEAENARKQLEADKRAPDQQSPGP